MHDVKVANSAEDLQFKSPESQGCTSSAIRGFVEKLEAHGLNMHSYMVIRNDCVIAEGYWRPFHAARQHRLYSAGKTVVALAIGLLADRRQISLDDPVVRFFPDKCPADLHPFVSGMTIRDLLIMAAPFTGDCYWYGCTDRVRAFLADKPTHAPGTSFDYNTSATYALVAIVERLTGMTFLEAMRPGLLDPIGVSPEIRCLKLPDGFSTSGSGILCTQRDFARIALLLQNKGQWHGHWLISSSFIEAMTSAQISNNKPGQTPHLDTGFGYGYQLWMTQNHSWSMIGMGDQLAICYPDKRLTFSCMADNQGNPAARKLIFQLVQTEIVDQLTDHAIAADPAARESLVQKNQSLVLAPCPGATGSPLADQINGRVFQLEDNPMGISEFSLHFSDHQGSFKYKNAQGDKQISFGLGYYEAGLFPQTGYPDENYLPSEALYECLASATWPNNDQLVLRIMTIGNFYGNLTITFCFTGHQVAVDMVRNAQFFLDEYEGRADGHLIPQARSR